MGIIKLYACLTLLYVAETLTMRRFLKKSNQGTGIMNIHKIMFHVNQTKSKEIVWEIKNNEQRLELTGTSWRGKTTNNKIDDVKKKTVHKKLKGSFQGPESLLIL